MRLTDEEREEARSRPFPIQTSRMEGVPSHPLIIPWSVADKAGCEYTRRYGDQQSIERLAQRGGLSGGEMDDLYPAWREEVSEIAALKARIAELEQDLAGGIRVKVAGKYLYTDERLQSEIAAAREEAEALAQFAEEDCQRAITARQKADLDLKCLQESTVDRKAWDQALARHEVELRALQSQIADLQRERDEDRTHNRQLRTDSVTLRGKIIKLDGIIHAKNADLSDLVQERDKLRAEVLRLRQLLAAPGLYPPTDETDKPDQHRDPTS